MNDLVIQPKNTPILRDDLQFRIATMDDLPFIDELQKKHTKQVGYFPTAQFKGYIEMGAVLIAEESGGRVSSPADPNGQDGGWGQPPSNRLGYIISRDRYLKRDELGVIYQLNVVPGHRRKMIGASLLREVFKRSAYGCKMYCCWCAQDIDANYFWESLGFSPIAFRAGSTGKKRVHIFWAKRINENDQETKWWYPSSTQGGAIREDRLVFPIPPGVKWQDVQAMPIQSPVQSEPKLIEGKQSRKILKSEIQPIKTTYRPGGMWIKPVEVPTVKQEKPKKEKVKKINPELIAKARELRDRYLEKVNQESAVLESAGKYDLTRKIETNEIKRLAA